MITHFFYFICHWYLNIVLKFVVIVKSYIIFEKNSCNIFKMLFFSNLAKYNITKTREAENMQLF
jgi:hypothetical protein